MASRNATRGWEDVLNQALVDAQLEKIPGLGTLTVGGLSGHDLKLLGLWGRSDAGSLVLFRIAKVGVYYRKPDGALDGEILGAGTVDELGADPLERLDLAAREGDADAVSFLESRNETVSQCVSSERGDRKLAPLGRAR